MASTTGAPYTAALNFGGSALPLPNTAKALTESWNGTSWTEVNDLNMGRSYIMGFGTQTSALAFGGYGPTPPASYRQLTESWNGTSWTEVNDFSSTASGGGGSAGVDNTTGLKYGGSPPANIATTEDWNGASWSETNDLPAGFSYGGSFGNASNAIAAGGYSGSTEGDQVLEFTSPSSTIKVLTD